MTTGQDVQTLAMMRTLLDRAHLATPGELPDVVAEAAQELGWAARLYLVDYEQEFLVLAPTRGSAVSPSSAPRLGIDSSIGGRCFRDVEPVLAAGGVAWVPLVDGVERLGALEIDTGSSEAFEDSRFQERIRFLGHLTGHLIAVKRPYGDDLARIVSRQPRIVASELLHRLLPPLTFACKGLVVSGLLQPYYDVAADAFDYSVIDDIAHLMIVDATGHDLEGTMLAAVALSAARSSRRQNHGLLATAQAIDDHVDGYGDPWRLASGILGELHLPTGRFRYLNAGHPAPLLLRRGKVVKELTGGHRILFGVGDGQGAVAEEWLEPGDRLVFYTDGITEARTPSGELFGVQRLIDHLERAASHQPAPETLRRISHDVRAHQGERLWDDATLLIAEWATGDENTLISSSEDSVRDDELAPPVAQAHDPSL